MLKNKKRNEITELIFESDLITDNIFKLTNAEKYQMIAILINREDMIENRYFLITENIHFINKVPEMELSQINILRDQFDYVSILYTKPKTVLKLKSLNTLKDRFSNDLSKMNFQYRFDDLLKNTDEFMKDKLKLSISKHIVVANSYITMSVFNGSNIRKDYFDLRKDSRWKCYPVNNSVG